MDGLGEGQRFVALDWVRRRFRDLLGIDPYPGTVNLRLAAEADRGAWTRLRSAPGIPFPPEGGFCAATCYRATILGATGQAIPAAIVVPHVSAYPAHKLELVAAVNVRGALGLQAGDPLTVHVQS